MGGIRLESDAAGCMVFGMRLVSVRRFLWLTIWRRRRLGICSQRWVVVGRMGHNITTMLIIQKKEKGRK